MNKRSRSRIGHLLATILIAALVLLAVGPAPAVSAQSSQPVACVTAYYLNVRSGPGLSYPVISILSRDQCVTLAGYRNAQATWVQVQLPAGGTGWVSAYYLSTSYPLTSLAVVSTTSPAPSPQPATSDWRGEYYANRDLVGTPALVRNDNQINFNWGLGIPAGCVPADNFSVRWTRTAQFDAGTYRFHALVDDGVRLWVDGQLILSTWQDGAAREIVVDHPLTQGTHAIRVEYYEHSGFARIQVWWERLSSTPSPGYPDWRGEYFSNRSLLGSSALVRSDPTIGFNWGLGAPAAGLPVDNFSVRWTRSAEFEGATYRFHTRADDGIRLWVDGQQIIDAWQDGAVREFVADLALTPGTHTIRVEYYEAGIFAEAHVWWEKVSAFPDWQGEYYSNRKLEGSPALVRNDKKIDFDWKDGRPASGLPKDNFSARWTRSTKFDAATYRFHVLVDDGARLWVDGKRIIDAWEDGPARELTADLALTKGTHSVKVEYYERSGDARMKVWWEKTAASFPEWKGEYYSNRKLEGSPALARNDQKIDFNWKEGSPAAGLPSDEFSVRWTREMEFEPGTYRFYAKVDDGIRVYIDDERVFSEWHDSDGSNKEYRFDRTLEGKHTLRVQYFEHGGLARITFRWEKQ